MSTGGPGAKLDQRVTVHLGHGDIGDDQPGRVRAQIYQGRHNIDGGRYVRKSVLDKKVMEGEAYPGIIIDDQNFDAFYH